MASSSTADPPYAFVTLVSSDAYLPGALVVAHALRDVHTRPAQPPEVDFQTVCLVTPETVDVSTIRSLRKAFDLVIGVEVIDRQAEGGKENLGLLGRRDLTTVLTKLHVFRLTQFKKIIFLDADTLPLQPISHLFSLPDKLAAAPDSGWPDCFNSGVMVLEPSQQSFDELTALVKEKGSWDGGDQGVLNEWAGGDWYRISFRYNTTPTAAYTYKPAYARFHEGINILHFIGPSKPWASMPIRPSRPPPPPIATSHDTTYGALVDQWYAVYDRHYRPLAGDDAFGFPDVSAFPTPGSSFDSGSEARAPFKPPHYAAAWDEPKPLQEQPQVSGGPHGLDQLRDLAIKGVGSMYATQEGEGLYVPLPLEGRVDLMRPRPEAEPVKELDREDDDATPRATRPPAPLPLPVPTGEYPIYLQRQDHPPPPPPPSAPPPTQTYFPPPPEEEQQSQHQAGPSHGEQARSAEPTHQEQWNAPHQEQQQPQEQHHWQPPPPGPSHEHHPPPQEQHQEQHYHVPPAPSGQEYHAPQPQHPPAPPPPSEPFSPPMMTWNPAYEPPPNEAPPSNATAFPEWTGNVWEQDPKHTHGFFQAPPPSQVPQHLMQQGHYSNVMGKAPDPSKVNAVFPWENQRRAPSGRAWPRGASPPPPPLPEIKPVLPEEMDNLAGPKLTVQGPSPPAPAQDLSHQDTASPISPPSHGLPSDMGFRNVWDADPHIQRYVSKLVRPTVGSRQSSFTAMRRSPLSTPGLKGNFTFQRPRERGEGADASSRDGDDEEDEQESESENGDRARVSGEESPDDTRAGGRKTPPRNRSGSVSTRAGEGSGQPAKTYRSQAVQTDPPPKKKSRGVQVARTDFFAPRGARKETAVQTTSPITAPKRLPLAPNPMPVPDTQYLLPQQQLPATPSPYDEPRIPSIEDDARYRQGDAETDDTAVALPGSDPSSNFESYFPRHATVESPREVAANPPTLHPGMAPLSPTMPVRPPPVPIPTHVRISSNDTQTTGGTSPPSSLLTSPRDGDDLTPKTSPKLSIRRWDPARDVDLFKRDSQEVLARFLRMNDWEETRT